MLIMIFFVFRLVLLFFFAVNGMAISLLRFCLLTTLTLTLLVFRNRLSYFKKSVCAKARRAWQITGDLRRYQNGVVIADLIVA